MDDGLTVGDILTADEMARHLRRAGLSEQAAAAKARMLAACAGALESLSVPQQAAAGAVFVPGRIEVLGKHTDYGGGRSLLAAAERGFCAVFVPRTDSTMRMMEAAGGRRAEFAVERDCQPAAGEWSNYPMTVARRVARNFDPPLRGADVAFASDLPPAAGMSSSSVLVVLTFVILNAVNRLEERPQYQANIDSLEALGGYLGTVENGQSFGTLPGDRGVGTFGGSEDHTAILCCRAGMLSQYSFCPVRFERRIPMPPDHVFAVGVSGVTAEKTGGAQQLYNRISLATSAIVRCWNEATGRTDPHLAAALSSMPDAAERLREVIRSARAEFPAETLLARLEQFHEEAFNIIPAAGDALVRCDLTTFGRLVDISQELAERGLGNQTPQTVFLARSARRIGAVAASAFGAGFGGSVWALVAQRDADAFLSEWRGAYEREFPECAAGADFFTTGAGPATVQLQRRHGGRGAASA